jgi:hypothetical protein
VDSKPTLAAQLQTWLEKEMDPEEWVEFLAWEEQEATAKADQEMLQLIRDWRLSKQM